ncbi:Phenylacetic acid catabolic protein, partial [Gordonia aichiensis]
DELALDAVGVGVDPRALRNEFDDVLEHIFSAAEINAPETATAGRLGGRAGRDGAHTEFLGHLLAEMQSVARAHPEGTW